MLRPGVDDSEELSTESRVNYHTANAYLDSQYFTVTHDACCDIHLAPIQGYYKQISDRTWRREGRVFMCCPCRFANQAFLRFQPMPNRVDYPGLSKSLWSISFHSEGGFKSWYLWSESVKPDESRWFWQSQAESNLKVHVGKRPLCCVYRGCFGSFLSCITIPIFFFITGFILVSLQVVTLPFLITFGLIVWVFFHICTCCLDSHRLLNHRDTLLEQYQHTIPEIITTYVPDVDQQTQSNVTDLLLDFAGFSNYPGWVTMQTKGTCNMFEWQTWPIQGHYRKVGWVNDAPLYKRRGKVYTWLPKMTIHEPVWIFHGGNGVWFTTFQTPSEDHLSSYIWKCKLQNYETFSRMVDSSDQWQWDDDSVAAVKLTEGRTWLLNSVCCPTFLSFLHFIAFPSYLLLFGVAIGSASGVLLTVAFVPLLFILLTHTLIKICQACGCCCPGSETNEESDSHRPLMAARP